MTMPNIGALLQKARSARGLELEEVAEATRIHIRYLAALESECFDELPGGAYARSFLREYAKYLGLDPELFLEELDSRLEKSEPGPLMLIPQRRSTRPRLVLLLVAACALVVALIAWNAGRGNQSQKLAAAHNTRPAKSALHAVRVPTSRAAEQAQLVVVASRGACWLSVHAGSESGPALYEGTLQQTRTLRFAHRRLWIRLGAPWNLEARLNGRPVRLPSSPGPVNVVVTKAGVRAV